MKKIGMNDYKTDSYRLHYHGAMMWSVYRRNDFNSEYTLQTVITGGSNTEFGAEKALDNYFFTDVEYLRGGLK